MSPFDRWLFRRTLLLIIVALALILLITCLTDERTATWAARAARLAAMSPGVGALAVIVADTQLRARGDAVALAALGVRPWRAARGSALACGLLGVVAVGLLACPATDASSLFPSLFFQTDWAFGGGDFVAAGSGVRVHVDGSLALGRTTTLPAALPALPAVEWVLSARVRAVLAVLPLAVATPIWSTAPIGRLRRAASALLAAAVLVLALHVSGVEQTANSQSLMPIVTGCGLAVAGCALLLQGLRGHFSSRG